MDSGVWQVGWWKGAAHQLLDYWWGGGGGSYMGATLESAGKGPATLSGEGLEGPPGRAVIKASVYLKILKPAMVS